MGALAFEPSTRTFSSFTAAMLRLGGSVLPLNSTTSSAVKGETLEDTVRVMEKVGWFDFARGPLSNKQ